MMKIRLLTALAVLFLLPSCAGQFSGQNMHNDAANVPANGPPQSITPKAVIV